MRKKNLLAIVLILFVFTSTWADEFKVKEFRHETVNLKARVNPVYDVNDQPCALLLVQTSVPGLGIESTSGIVGNLDYKNGEYWVYLVEGTRRISFFAKGITKYNFDFPMRIKGSEVYIIQLDVIREIQPEESVELGYLSINTVPSRANILIDREPTGMQSFMNTSLPEGNHHITLTLPGYMKADTILSITAGQMKGLDYQFIKDPEIELLRQQPLSSSTLNLELTPAEQVHVNINGEWISSFASGGIPLRVGKNKLSVFKQHYVPVDTIIEVSDNQQVIEWRLALQPVFGSIIIETVPPADIIIDKKQVGVGSYVANLCEGYHLIEVSVKNYKVKRDVVRVKRGQSDSLVVRLNKKTAALNVITNPVGAQVFLDDSLIGNSPVLVSGLPIVNHKVIIKHPGYATLIQDVDMTNDMTYSLNPDLLMGRNLKVTSFPSESEVLYNGFFIGKTPFDFSFPMQDVILSVENEGYDPLKDTVSIFSVVDSIHFDLTKTAAGPSMVFIKGGCYKRKQGYTNFQVCVDDFYLSKYEVTNKEFCAFLNVKKVNSSGVLNNKLLIGLQNNQVRFDREAGKFVVGKEFEQFPVNYVTWDGAQQYCEWQHGRLPTEAEWLFAAQERGLNEAKFSGSDDIEFVGWYKKNSKDKVRKVGGKNPNLLGLYDMSGNLFEWCYDWYLDPYFVNCPVSNPMGPKDGWSKVLKGGSVDSQKRECEVTQRFKSTKETSKFYIGFRLARPEKASGN
ncbi:PEGA domain-containing protein, partial [bacterium]|nr:PEGA domain-containing protein [bacterium]